ncbi:hypothetical protein [Sphaerochaeta halotolerans]|jgi:hypothetical protein|uniref:hypothetical protein n=1 Tax=Sphaerochaeta halotolerans TaxID=2293840 RepID=UPI00136B9F73|nr:hypothetical protein [Sphaerochaeta halotolerans]MBG0767085.1 hypothetical protein [Spirochaetaceae bacterium]MDK2858894.1 hypothetical protein [Sphaerochaeta sp.]MDN5332918.1 hypothetical protein [Sphaerochaeta sp.]MXI87451.1 hypothetical protein [Sphaerochaeta halotolerans]
MGHVNERAQEAFKTLLSRYSEDTYFYLARNYLGKLQSPFHKPQLTTKLCQLFSQESMVQKTLSMLDSFDQVILSLLATFGSLTVEQITSLLKGTFSYGNLLRRVGNLQERMILLSDAGRLVFNPLLEDQLLQYCSLRPLCGEEEHHCVEAPYCSTEFLRGFFSLVAKEGKCIYHEGISQHFPTYERDRLKEMYQALGEYLTEMGVLVRDARRCTLDWQKAEALLSLSDYQLLCLLLSRNLEGTAPLEFANALLSTLQTLGGCDTTALKLLIKGFCLRYQVAYTATLLNELSTWGVLTLDENWQVSAISGIQERTALLIDSDQTISYQGNCPAGDILYRFAYLEVLDHQRTYHITKESMLGAFDSSLDYPTIKEYLETNSARGMNMSLLKQFEMLSERYQNITIYDGMVLSCDQRTANLIHNLPSLSEHRLVTLSPTIFIMRRDSEDIWRQVLKHAGQLVGATKSFDRIEILEKKELPILRDRIGKAKTLSQFTPLACHPLKPVAKASLDESLRQAIAKADLSKAEREDLEHRFQSRTILLPSQIVPQVLNPILEAGGFDYQGKVSLCKQAAGKKDILLELQLPDQELIVQALELAFTPQKEALLKAAVMPSMEVKILPVSKLFLIRLVRFHFA